jgi:hypothetical protein
MGKREKEHRRKVRNRNQRLAEEKARFKKEYEKLMAEQVQALKEQYAKMSGETTNETNENVLVNESSEQ